MRILIIEDESGIADFLREGLEEECFAVDVAHNGREGLSMALINEYDLLIVDWLLPGLSGVEVCRQFRKEHAQVPVIFLTAKGDLDDVIFGLESGANDYMKKPFAFEELLARIRVQLRLSGSETVMMQAGGVEMNLAAHRVTCNGKDVSLTPKEFALLEYLLRNRGSVCTRSRIIEHVWDIHFDADTSVIDVYVNFLRKKLDGAGCGALIETVRGVGYVIRGE
ncbi:MAG: response regulator transcription factor [Chlorobium phaeobacteroides]|uniref:Two component transcriptional regulator, winged helix family n=1 Tax=Chlorobium phaeobacteroides (strain BS1) TaxID=331678 RepID=B3EQ01_CHLPB|nr:response regulator transcription factor [Chlorobium phaeobacteroides]